MNIKINLLFVIVFFVGINRNIFPQYFAPLQYGNVWICKEENGSIVKFTVLDTNYFINNHNYYRIIGNSDTTYPYIERYRGEDSMYVQYSPNILLINNELPAYKFNSMKGDTWSVGPRNYPISYKIIDEFPFNVFNKPVMIKVLNINHGGLVEYRELWTDEFGLLSGLEGEGGGIYFNLKACIINGIVFGDTSTGVNENNNLVYNFTLFQNYPNPFNPSTNIEFEIREYSFVSLKVYDILGKNVADLINENKHPGRYKIKFDADKLASSIYFYKLTAGGKTQIKKMILLK